MTSMDMTAPGARAATRALAVLAVLLGLLAMHGLAGTHHAAAASAAPHAAQGVTAPAAEAGAHEHAAVASPAVDHTAAPAGSPGTSCDEICPALVVLCLAVLTGAALTLLLARRRFSPLLLPAARTRGPVSAPPGRHTGGPDPVRELCVSRT